MRENSGKKFIYTTSKKNADEMLKLGYHLINTPNDNLYMFYNLNKIGFSENIDQSKIYYTNLMYC